MHWCISDEKESSKKNGRDVLALTKANKATDDMSVRARDPREIVRSPSQLEGIKLFVDDAIVKIYRPPPFQSTLNLGALQYHDQLGEAWYTYHYNEKNEEDGICEVDVTVKSGMQLHEVMGAYAHKMAAITIDVKEFMSEDAGQLRRNYAKYYEVAYKVVKTWNPAIAEQPRHRGMLDAALKAWAV